MSTASNTPSLPPEKLAEYQRIQRRLRLLLSVQRDLKSARKSLERAKRGF